jgi:hypothetical protein
VKIDMRCADWIYSPAAFGDGGNNYSDVLLEILINDMSIVYDPPPPSAMGGIIIRIFF